MPPRHNSPIPLANPTERTSTRTVQEEVTRLKHQLGIALERAKQSERDAVKPRGIELAFPMMRQGKAR